MTDIIKGKKITQPEFDAMAAPLELDLVAYFNTLEDLVMKGTFDNTKTPEKLIDGITGIFDT